MEADQKVCPTHNLYQSFRCFQCKVFLCPTCLAGHKGHKGLIRTDTTVHFLTYNTGNGCAANHEVVLWLYKLPENKPATSVSLTMDAFFQESIIVQNILYIMGGITSTSSGKVNKAFDSVHTYNINAGGALVAKANMLTPAFAGALCTVDDSAIYTIGGRNSSSDRNGYLDVCEKYDIKTNTWTKLLPLTKARGNITLGVFNCEFIYAMGGYTFPEGFHDLLEVFDTKDERKPWTVVPITHCGRKYYPRNAMCLVQTPDANAFMIFGGCHQLGITTDIFELNLDTKKRMVSPMKLPKPAAFIQRRPMYYRGCYYLEEYGHKAGIYVFDPVNKTVKRKGRKDYIPIDLIKSKIKSP